MSIVINSYGQNIAIQGPAFKVTVTITKGKQIITFTCMSDQVDKMIASYR
jgi:hypothetical protein